MTRALVFSLAAFCACCALPGVQPLARDVGITNELTDAPGLAAASVAIWQSYGQTNTPPRVVLMTGKDLSCIDPKSGNPGFPVMMASGPDCREGWTVLPNVTNVAYRGQPWSQSSLAHEYEHAKLMQLLQGDPPGDPGHATAGFQLGGEVDQANAALSAGGS